MVAMSMYGVQLPASTRAPRMARRCVTAACDGLDEGQRAVAELLVSEVVTDLLRRPGRDPTGDPAIEVSVYRLPWRLLVWVHDRSSRPAGVDGDPTAEMAESVRVLLALADGWGSGHRSGGGRVLWFAVRQVRRPGPGPGPGIAVPRQRRALR